MHMHTHTHTHTNTHAHERLPHVLSCTQQTFFIASILEVGSSCITVGTRNAAGAG